MRRYELTEMGVDGDMAYLLRPPREERHDTRRFHDRRISLNPYDLMEYVTSRDEEVELMLAVTGGLTMELERIVESHNRRTRKLTRSFF